MTGHHHGVGHAGHSHISGEMSDEMRKRATAASMSVAAVLIVAKAVGYVMTDSVAMLSSLFDSAIDLFASLVTAYGVAKAMRPPDHNHRYGHGKAEPLAAFAQAAFVIGSAIFLAVEAIRRLHDPQPVEGATVAYAILALAIVLTFFLIRYQQHVVTKTGSVAISADRLHYAGDLAINIAVAAAFGLRALTGYDWFDSVFALGIAAYLLVPAWQIVNQALHALMDTELDDREREAICDIVRAQDGVYGVHDLRTRTDGEAIFIDCHVEMDGALTLNEAHNLSERVAAAIIAQYPHADVLIKQDPVGLDEVRRDNQIAARDQA